MSVSYEEAVATLCAMFPAFPRGVIEDGLRKNHGAMEPTVEHLLMLDAAPVQGREPQRGPSAAAGSAPPRERDNPMQRGPIAGRAAAAAAAPAHPRRQRVALAPDFLILPPELVSVAVSARVGSGGGRPSAGPSSAPQHPGGRALTQMEQDEQLAMMLQNEGFVDSLAADPEFAAYLRANPAAAAALGIPVPAHAPGAGRQAQSGAAGPGAPQRGPAGGAARAPAPAASTRSAASGSLSSSGRIVGLSGGGSPPQAAGAPSGGGDILGAMTSMGADMRRRFDAVAARFRRSNTASGGVGWSTSSAGGAAAVPTSGGLMGMFDRSGGRAAYAQVPSGGGEGEARVGGYRDQEEEREVEIELSGADNFNPTFPEQQPKGGAGGGGGGGAAGSSFAIDDEEEDSRASLTASFGASADGASGGRPPKHV